MRWATQQHVEYDYPDPTIYKGYGDWLHQSGLRPPSPFQPPADFNYTDVDFSSPLPGGFGAAQPGAGGSSVPVDVDDDEEQADWMCTSVSSEGCFAIFYMYFPFLFDVFQFLVACLLTFLV